MTDDNEAAQALEQSLAIARSIALESAARAPQSVAQRKEKRNARDRQRSHLQKRSMQEMRAKVAQLEAVKKSLEQRYGDALHGNGSHATDNQAALPAHHHDPCSSPEPATTTDDDEDGEEQAAVRRLQTAQQRYLAVLQLLETLRRENRAMALTLLDRDLSRSAVVNLLEAQHMETTQTTDLPTTDTEKPGPEAPYQTTTAAAAAAVLPEEEVLLSAQQLFRAIHNARTACPLMEPLVGAPVFGWCDLRSQSGTSATFVITKRFPGHAAENLAHSTWNIISDDVEMRKLLPPGLYCEFHEVQRLSPHLRVVNRLTVDHKLFTFGGQAPRKLPPLRTVYTLLYTRDPTGGGFVLGMKTLDRPLFRSWVSGNETWCDVFYWFSFTPCPRDPLATVVQFGGTVSYVIEATARFWLAELVFLAIRWESMTVASVFLKHRSKDDEDEDEDEAPVEQCARGTGNGSGEG